MTASFSRRLFVTATFAVCAAPASAQSIDPASVPVRHLSDGLIDIMKAGASAGFQGRERRVEPVVDSSFDLGLMTRLAVGPGWTSIAPAEQTALAAAFRRMTVARYAGSFKGYSGEAFVVDPKVEARGVDRLVHTKLTRPRGNPVALDYRVRQVGGRWRIIDIYYQNTISQIATQRADFSRIFASGGAKALTAHLNDLAAKAASG